MLEQLERREGRRHIDDRPTNDPPGMHMALHIQHMMGGPSPPESMMEEDSDEERPLSRGQVAVQQMARSQQRARSQQMPPQSELDSDEEQMANEAQHLAEDDDWANDELVDALNPLLNDSEMKHLEELLSD